MAYITLGTATQLQIKVPTIGSTDWADEMRTATFIKIAEHLHTGNADGSQLGTASITADAITGAKIRLDNDEYLRARNAANTTDINVIKADATDALVLGAAFKNNTYITFQDQAATGTVDVIKVDGGDEIAFGADIAGIVYKHNTYFQADNAAASPANLFKIDINDDFYLDPDVSKLNLKNATYITARNNADNADVNVLRVNTSDKIELGLEIATVVKLSNNLGFQNRNAADNAYVDTIKLNASDQVALGADLANAALINNVALQHRNAADNAYIETIKVNASDFIEVGAQIGTVLKLSNNLGFQNRNAADSAYIDTIKLNGSDLIELGANVVAANVATLGTSLIDTLSSAVTLADNQSATTAGIVTLSTDESCAVHYRIVRNGVTQNGVVRFNDADTIPSETFHGTDVGVTFTVSSGALFYATTSTGNTGSMTYVVVKE